MAFKLNSRSDGFSSHMRSAHLASTGLTQGPIRTRLNSSLPRCALGRERTGNGKNVPDINVSRDDNDNSYDEDDAWPEASTIGGTDSYYETTFRQPDAGYTTPRPGPQRQRGRRVFTFKNWRRHRETSRYFRHLKGILTSATFTSLKAPLLFFTAHAALVATYQWSGEAHLLPANFPLLALDENPITLTSFALSLLLVFRTDASYARWNECLGAWSDVRNTAKEIGRAGSIWVKTPALQQTLRRWTVAFPRCLQVYLREHGDIRAELSSVLLPHELTKLTAAHNYPHFVLHVLTEVVGRAGLSEIREDILLASIAKFSKAIGVCEKIMRYPIPLSYSRHTSRFMCIWLCLLPFSLWPGCKWAMIPITGFVAFLLLGIEEIGVQIEEPFSLLPLEDFCSDIERDMAAIMLSKDSVQELVASVSGSSSYIATNSQSGSSISSNVGSGSSGRVSIGSNGAEVAFGAVPHVKCDGMSAPLIDGGDAWVLDDAHFQRGALSGAADPGPGSGGTLNGSSAVVIPTAPPPGSTAINGASLLVLPRDLAQARRDLRRASLDFDD